MKDPRRLLEGDASELELRLLTLAQREQAPSAAPRRLAARLGVPVGMLGLEALGSGPAPLGSVAAPPAAVGAGAGSGLLHGIAGKLVLAGVLGALGGGLVVGVTGGASRPSTRVTPSPSVAPSTLPSPPLPSSASVGQLDREVAALARVRGALQAGRAQEALAALRAFEQQHPSSVLGQEAHALRIEALLAVRDVDAARAEGERFLRSYPDSPHRARVQALLRAARPLR